MALEIRPLTALYPPLQIMCFIELQSRALLSISAVSAGAVCSCLRHLCPFLLYQLKKVYGLRPGGQNAARGLISRDIAKKFKFHQY